MTFLCWMSRLLNWQISSATECAFTGLICKLTSALMLSLHCSNTDPSTMLAKPKLQLHASAMLEAIPWLMRVTARGPWWNNRKVTVNNKFRYNKFRCRVKIKVKLCCFDYVFTLPYLHIVCLFVCFIYVTRLSQFYFARFSVRFS